MANTLDDALARLARTRPLDHMANMAEAFLEVDAVLLVRTVPFVEILGSSDSAATIDGALLKAATDLPPVYELDLTDGADVPGRLLPPGSPYKRAVHVPLSASRWNLACLAFLSKGACTATRLRSFIAMGSRQISDAVLIERYRADLKRYILMFDHIERTARIGMWEYDLRSGAMFWSDEVFRILDLPLGPVPSLRSLLRLVPPPARRKLWTAVGILRTDGTPFDLSLPMSLPRHAKRTVRIIASYQRAADGHGRVAGVFQDVTDQQEANDRLWWTANHDILTELPNRAMFTDRFRMALERRARTGRLACLVLIDVDKFKDVNDTLGHQAGDAVLHGVARQLAGIVRANDTVARTGGDEFSILLEDIEDETALMAALERIRANLAIRFNSDERSWPVTLSAGAAVAPQHGTSERVLSQSADLALYKAKTEPGGSLALFDSELGTAAAKRNALLSEVRQALEAGRIVPWYQPQVDVASGRIVGVEALARWITAERVLTATEFAAALEDLEIGAAIGRAVAGRAMAEIASLNQSRAEKIALSINAASNELMRNHFLKRLAPRCRSQASASPIRVEISESVILDDPTGEITERMRAATAAGMTFSLDDFGSGYASLLQVSTLPISEVKVGRRFLTGIEDDPAKQKVIGGMIELARSLGLRLILEGVETKAQADQIAKLGGRFAQGFYYSKAVPLDELARLLDADDDRAATVLDQAGHSAPDTARIGRRSRAA